MNFIPPPVRVDGTTITQAADGTLSAAANGRRFAYGAAFAGPNATTRYACLSGFSTNVGAPATVYVVAPFAMTLSALYVNASAASNATITVHKGGADTALTVAMGGGTSGNLTGQTVAVAAGDLLAVKVQSAGNETAISFSVGVAGVAA